MKRLRNFVVLSLLMMTCTVFYAGCSDKALNEEVLWDAKPSVMIDGVLYGTTGYSPAFRTADAPENGGRVDGMITSSVAGHEYPVENDQSNFGTGYYYRYGENNTIEVFSDSANNWIIYEAYEDQ